MAKKTNTRIITAGQINPQALEELQKEIPRESFACANCEGQNCAICTIPSIVLKYGVGGIERTIYRA